MDSHSENSKTQAPFAPARRLAFAALLLLTTTPAMSAEEWLALNREAAVHNALRQNAELRVASFEVARARARLRWSGKLKPPEIELLANTDQFGNNENESLFAVGIAQGFPLTDRLKREKSLSRVQVAMAEAEIADARRRLIAEVERSFVLSLSAREQVAVLEDIRDLLEGSVKILEQQAARGVVSALDVNQAKLDQQRIEKNLLRQRSETKRRLSSLKTLLGLTDDTGVSPSGGLDLPKNGSRAPEIRASRERRPDFQLAVLNEDRARAELALASANRWEDIALRLFAEREASVDEPVGLDRNTFIGVGVSIPLPLKKERATAEQTVSVDQAKENSRAVALKIENRIAALIRVRDDLLELARDTAGETLELAEENLDAIRKAYQNGQIELLKFQRAQEQLLEARLGALEAREAYHTAEIDLREAAATHSSIHPQTSGK